MSIMGIGLQMQAMVGYMACGTAIFDTFFLDATNTDLSLKRRRLASPAWLGGGHGSALAREPESSASRFLPPWGQGG
jgi:hypothetical protein